MSDAVKFKLGLIVYHRTSEDGDDVRGIITGIVFRDCGTSYLVTWSDSREEMFCFACELTTRRPPMNFNTSTKADES